MLSRPMPAHLYRVGFPADDLGRADAFGSGLLEVEVDETTRYTDSR